jgi:hypothetical protein
MPRPILVLIATLLVGAVLPGTGCTNKNDTVTNPEMVPPEIPPGRAPGEAPAQTDGEKAEKSDPAEKSGK